MEATSLTDSVFVAVESNLVGPYDDPLIPHLTLSTKHFWTINRYDFGEAEVKGMFDFSKNLDGDIIQSENDSATLLYRKDATLSPCGTRKPLPLRNLPNPKNRCNCSPIPHKAKCA